MLELLIAGITVPFIAVPIAWDEDPRTRPWIRRCVFGAYLMLPVLAFLHEFYGVNFT